MAQPKIIKIVAHEHDDDRSYALEFVREGQPERSPLPVPAIVCGALSARLLANALEVEIEWRDHLPFRGAA